MKTLNSKKYGIDLPRFTHKSSAIIYASTKEDDTIRYHSLHDNKYLQYFRGHKARVCALEMSPTDDGFLSASTDRTVRMWDLRTPQCRGLLTLPAPAVVAYDPSGMVFAVGVNAYQRILLYDVANFDKAPFATFTLDDPSLSQITYPPRPIYMTSLQFSTNAKFLLVGCSGNAHYILDAFNGSLLAKLEGHEGLERRVQGQPLSIQPQRGMSGEEVGFTPDSKFVVSGSLDGRVFIWDLATVPIVPPEPGQDDNPPYTGPVVRVTPLVALEGHPGPARSVKFNPRFAMMASAGAQLVRLCFSFWGRLASVLIVAYIGILGAGSEQRS